MNIVARPARPDDEALVLASWFWRQGAGTFPATRAIAEAGRWGGVPARATSRQPGRKHRAAVPGLPPPPRALTAAWPPAPLAWRHHGNSAACRPRFVARAARSWADPLRHLAARQRRR
ncbi:MAG TPA: hypothetical protein VMG38_13710 [Trebonia sp.]|nr:hypothetical protein [Trebonia sp.]